MTFTDPQSSSDPIPTQPNYTTQSNNARGCTLSFSSATDIYGAFALHTAGDIETVEITYGDGTTDTIRNTTYYTSEHAWFPPAKNVTDLYIYAGGSNYCQITAYHD